MLLPRAALACGATIQLADSRPRERTFQGRPETLPDTLSYARRFGSGGPSAAAASSSAKLSVAIASASCSENAFNSPARTYVQAERVQDATQAGPHLIAAFALGVGIVCEGVAVRDGGAVRCRFKASEINLCGGSERASAVTRRASKLRAGGCLPKGLGR